MEKGMTIQEAGTKSEGKADHRAQLAHYLARQPESKRTFDRVMKALEVAGLALLAGYVAWAIYVSANWTVAREIVAVWFAFPLCATVLMVLVGVHAAGLGAFFPVALPGGPQEFSTGSKAVASGVGLSAMALVIGAFWGAFAYGIWTTNWAVLEPLTKVLVAVVSAGAVIAVVTSMYQKLMGTR
jgi:hypothetical protein